MLRDDERLARITQTLVSQGWQALLVAQPANVLLVSGYWPVLGTALALVTQAGHVALLVPEDEKDLAEQSWADDVKTFAPSSLFHVPKREGVAKGSNYRAPS